jgi:mannose-6-phosphate isomerase-like protein (cupin superfamily)
MATAQILATGTLEPGYSAPTAGFSGGASSALLHPADFSLWMVSAQVDAGSVLTWDAAHGDEGLWVITGELEAEGQRVGADGAIIVEGATPAEVRVPVDTELRHFGPVAIEAPDDGPFGPPATDDHGIHVVAADEAASRRREGSSITARRFADSKCPTCRIALFTVESDAGYSLASHFHSEDEIIHVLDGELQVGRTEAPAGTSIMIPAGVRYGFKSRDPFRFVNFRRDASYYTQKPGSAPRLEGQPLKTENTET